MNSFTEIVKKHGLILWLCHVVASLIVFGVIMLLVMVGVFAAVGIGISSMYSITMQNIIHSLQHLSLWAVGGTAIFLGLIGILVFLLSSSFGRAGGVAVTASAVNRDEATFQIFFWQGYKNMWRILGLWFVSFIVCFVPLGLVGSIAAYLLGGAFTDGAGVNIGAGIFSILVMVILGLFIGLGLLFSQYILIAENEPIWKSICASFALLRKEFGQVFLTGLILLGVGFAFAVPSMLWLAGGRSLAFSPSYNLIVSPIVATLVTLILTYRYYRYMRPTLYPEAIQEDVIEPVGNASDESDKTEI